MFEQKNLPHAFINSKFFDMFRDLAFSNSPKSSPKSASNVSSILCKKIYSIFCWCAVGKLTELIMLKLMTDSSREKKQRIRRKYYIWTEPAHYSLFNALLHKWIGRKFAPKLNQNAILGARRGRPGQIFALLYFIQVAFHFYFTIIQKDDNCKKNSMWKCNSKYSDIHSCTINIQFNHLRTIKIFVIKAKAFRLTPPSVHDYMAEKLLLWKKKFLFQFDQLSP